MDEIIKILKELEVKEYRIIERKVYSKEWFFIQKKLDMSRAKEVKNYELTIYQPIYLAQERFKGEATAKISPKEDEDSIREIISNLIKEASYIRNPYFDLPSFMEVSEDKYSTLGDIQDVFKMMNDFHETDELSLNSYELFEEMEEVRIVNSKGYDITYMRPSHELEVVINAKDNDHEIEIYQDLRFGTPSITDINQTLAQACHQAMDRKVAIPMSKTEICDRVIISKENVLSLMNYYVSQLNTTNIYQKNSIVSVGDTLGPDGFKLEGLANLEGSSRNYPFDDDGRTVKNVELVDNGVVKQLWGDHKTASYLNLSNTTMVYNYKVACGTMSMEDMHALPHLELVQFSSFSVNPLTGDFAGEIRLGYYFDGTNTTPITGGSISGNIKVNEPTMVLSKELSKYNYAVVPQAVLLNHVSISV